LTSVWERKNGHPPPTSLGNESVTNAPGTTFIHIFDNKTTTVIACRDQKYETPVLKVNGKESDLCVRRDWSIYILGRGLAKGELCWEVMSYSFLAISLHLVIV